MTCFESLVVGYFPIFVTMNPTNWHLGVLRAFSMATTPLKKAIGALIPLQIGSTQLVMLNLMSLLSRLLEQRHPQIYINFSSLHLMNVCPLLHIQHPPP